MQYVLAVAETIGQHMESHRIVINKSTVPVGTADQVRERIAHVLAQRGGADLSFDVVSSPEFLKEYSAELTKYAANCMLAIKTSSMTKMANLAERLGANIEMVRKGIGSGRRIGYQFTYPGVGYGGSCFPKDVQALIRIAEGMDFNPRILKAVEARNQEQKTTLFQKIQRHFNGQLAGKTIALWQAGARVQVCDPEAMVGRAHG